MQTSRGLRFDDSRFWVTHRRREYGPFDYEWSKDFCGVEFLYCGEKFGEYCSIDEMCADLKEFCLPKSVVDVASIALGCIVFGVLNGMPTNERYTLIAEHLAASGYDGFLNFRYETDRDR